MRSHRAKAIEKAELTQRGTGFGASQQLNMVPKEVKPVEH